jgi:cyclopropane-fatty-acyl-phospholipid synthase
MALIDWCERGLIPDFLTRIGIRRLCRQRLREEYSGDWRTRQTAFVEQLRHSAVAIETQAANEQHYELPPEFFLYSLGKRLKYSSCYYPRGEESLDQAEEAMLKLYGERAELSDGQRILELGCGWGSLTLWMAEKYPQADITAVSNSAPQRLFIEARAAERGLKNVRIITQDVNQLTLEPAQFDRVVSIEMFEHMRNYEELLRRVASWLKDDGKLFVHIFCHREVAYPYEVEGEDNWMGRYFFTGGQMPAFDTFRHFARDLRIEADWRVAGTHYERTSNQWLETMDLNRARIMPVFEKTYGANAKIWFQRWRMFYMACAELFGYDSGQEWLVGHYRFSKSKASS